VKSIFKTTVTPNPFSGQSRISNQWKAERVAQRFSIQHKE
jgi:hypothetical protein